jgi:hypothetical protein
VVNKTKIIIFMLIYKKKWYGAYMEEEFEDTKGVIRICKSREGQTTKWPKVKDKRTNNDLQNISIVAEKNVTKNVYICSMCIKTN